MIRSIRTVAISLVLLAAALPGFAAAPDYSGWTSLLQKYYSPQNGMDYQGLKKGDYATLTKLADDLSKVDVAQLSRDEQLAFWINLYNVSTVKLICDNYPKKSIRDMSTDPLIRLNVFDKKIVPLGGETISLNDIENVRLRQGFKDPRIHFAINCAAKSCPPIRTEAFVGARVSEQLDDQARAFLNGAGAKISKKSGKTTLTVTKIMDWFKEDFESAGGAVAFTKKFLTTEKQAALGSGKVSLAFFDYNWELNDWKR